MFKSVYLESETYVIKRDQVEVSDRKSKDLRNSKIKLAFILNVDEIYR
jgi:hypothetical protein